MRRQYYMTLFIRNAEVAYFSKDDFKFNRIWNNPKRYLEFLKNFKGIISPDFSLYRNMPLSM